MRIFLLLLLLAVCLLPVLCERDRPCQELEFHECVPVEDCDHFLKEQEKLKDLETGLERKKQKAFLKDLTCNNKPKKVCCLMPNLKSDGRLDLFKARIV